MHSVIINGKKYNSEDGAPLKDALLAAGFNFPCGGNGKCGKCRIKSKDLPVTDLDERFLSLSQIDEGIRVACDKTVLKSLNLTCTVGKKRENIKLKNCSIAVSVTDSGIEIAIVGEETVETVYIKNPIVEISDLSMLAENYKNDPNTFTAALRGAISREAIELFEAYGAAKAETLAVGAKPVYLKILAGVPLDTDISAVEKSAEHESFGLPTESLYILPSIGDFIGGEILAESIKLKERSLLIDCEKTVSIIHICDKDDLATAIWGCDYSDVALRCIRAAVKFLIDDTPKPIIYLYGEKAYETEDALSDLGVSMIHRDKDIENVVNALMSFRTRAKLSREKERTTLIRLYDYEKFQSYLTETPNF